MNRRAPLIAGIAIAIVAVLAVVILVLPKMGEVGDTNDELSTAQDQEITLQAQLSSLQDAQAQAPQTQRKIAQIEDQIPPTADLPALFRLLQDSADRSAVDFFTFSPGTPTVDLTGAYSSIPSQISVTGTYFSLDEFLFLMETLPRAARVTSVSLSPSGNAGTSGTSSGSTTSTDSLQMQITIEFYTTDTSAGPGSVPGPSEPVTSGAAGATGASGATGATP